VLDPALLRIPDEEVVMMQPSARVLVESDEEFDLIVEKMVERNL
jgi:hypothetical protein